MLTNESLYSGILAIDHSASVNGDREAWVLLCKLHLAEISTASMSLHKVRQAKHFFAALTVAAYTCHVAEARTSDGGVKLAWVEDAPGSSSVLSLSTVGTCKKGASSLWFLVLHPR